MWTKANNSFDYHGMNGEHDLFSISRKIGSTGLVIFERDGLLLRRTGPISDLTLGDLDEEFVEMLKQLRDQNLRFGFISDQRGMDAESYGRSEFAALVRVLDELLSLYGVMPDFWMAWDSPPRSGTEIRHRDGQLLKPVIGMILHAVEWYGVDKKKAVFVSSSSAGILAAKQAKITGIHYSGWRNDKVTEAQRLGDTIERILGVEHRRTA